MGVGCVSTAEASRGCSHSLSLFFVFRPLGRRRRQEEKEEKRATLTSPRPSKQTNALDFYSIVTPVSFFRPHRRYRTESLFASEGVEVEKIERSCRRRPFFLFDSMFFSFFLFRKRKRGAAAAAAAATEQIKKTRPPRRDEKSKASSSFSLASLSLQHRGSTRASTSCSTSSSITHENQTGACLPLETETERGRKKTEDRKKNQQKSSRS